MSEYEQLLEKADITSDYKEYFKGSILQRYRNKYIEQVILTENKSKKVLNVGDGTGTTSSLFVREGFTQVFGIDVEEKFLNIARKRCPKATFTVGDAHNIPFPEKSFSILTYVDVIEFLSAKKTISEASRVLERGGTLYIENFNSIMLSTMKKYLPFIKASSHYQTNTNYEIVRLLKKNGFAIKKFDCVIAQPLSVTRPLSFVFYSLMRIRPLRMLFCPVSYFICTKVRP